MNKKIIILLISLITIIIILFILSFPKTQNKSNLTPSLNPNPPAILPKNQFNLDQLEIQKLTREYQNAQNFGQALTSLHQKYPWYSKLPIETKDYIIIYDFDKNSFRIRLLTQISKEIKQSAIDQLNKIEVDLNKFSYYFLE
ncbi:MAG: hypothetical protein ABIJ43_04755 [Candidatus Beckwithbacteria bacterium]